MKFPYRIRVDRISKSRVAEFLSSLHYMTTHLATAKNELGRLADAQEVANALSQEQNKLYAQFVKNQEKALELQERGLEMTLDNIKWTREQVTKAREELEKN